MLRLSSGCEHAYRVLLRNAEMSDQGDEGQILKNSLPKQIGTHDLLVTLQAPEKGRCQGTPVLGQRVKLIIRMLRQFFEYRSDSAHIDAEPFTR